jgi:UDP-glucose 4-epimerase
MYLVTGGAGFIGSHIAAALIERGERVRIFDNFSSGKVSNLESLGFSVEVMKGDLADLAAVRKAMSGVRIVFHQGADPSVNRSMEDPSGSYRANVLGTVNVLQAAKEAGARRVVFASSCAVYGDSPVLPKLEAMTPEPLSPYAASKLAGEELCTLFAGNMDLEAVALRYFNVFGPRQDPSSAYAPVIPKFIAALRDGGQPTIFGDGEQTRDFVYVEDVVRANLLAAETPGASGAIVNVASGRSISLNRLAALIGELMNRTVSPDYLPARSGDIRDSSADVRLAKDVLGFERGVSFEDGLARTVASMTDAFDANRASSLAAR